MRLTHIFHRARRSIVVTTATASTPDGLPITRVVEAFFLFVEDDVA